MAGDLNKPANSSVRTAFMQEIRDNQTELAKMSGSQANLPDGIIKYSSGNLRFEKYSTGAWAALDISGTTITNATNATNADTLDTYHASQFVDCGGSQPVAGGLYNNSIRTYGYSLSWQTIANTGVTLTFTEKPIKIYLRIQAKNTATIQHELQAAINIDGVLYGAGETGPGTAPTPTSDWQDLTLIYWHAAGLSGSKTISGSIKVDAGAGTQITVYKTSILVEEFA